MSTSALSKSNKESILKALLNAGALTKADIARETGLSVATASRLAETLLEDGFLLDAGESTDTGGRPSRLLQFNHRVAVTLTLDVRGPATDIALVDLGGDVCAIETVPGAADPPDRIQQTLTLAAHGLGLARQQGLRCIAAGVSVPGPVDADGTVAFAPALSWRRISLGARLTHHLALPVLVDNDANLLALGEFRRGRASGVESLIAVAVYEGVGLGIIEGGRIWRGAHGAAGQLGRMLYDISALRSDFTGFGSLETRLGSVGIARRAHEAGIASGTDDAILRQLMARHQLGDDTATDLLSRVFDEFAMSLTNLCAILDPESVVLAGLFSDWSEVVIPALRERLAVHVLHQPQLVTATPHLAATLIGAGHAAFEHFGGITNLL